MKNRADSGSRAGRRPSGAARRTNGRAPHFGVHLTIDGYGGAHDRLADFDHVRACLDELPPRVGMHKIAEPLLVEVGELDFKVPGGVSGFVLIAESHISVHTFPLRGFVSADVYTCQNWLDVERITRYFTEAFALKDIETHVIRRGTRYPQHNLYDGATGDDAYPRRAPRGTAALETRRANT